jgi:CO/xanthine dehydrogenase Mo-binding subunit
MMAEGKLLVKGTVPPPLDREFTVVGKPLNRRDGVEKVTGRAKYSGDIKLPNMLCGKILRCPYPRARIVKIDTSKAEALPGVKALLTKENTKGWRTKWYLIPQIAFPECITYEGQEVAAVAAEDISIAQRALELIDVEYEVLTPMLDAEETLKSPPPPCVADEEYPGRDIYDRKAFVIKRGDVNKGFEEADVIIEDTYSTQAQYHGMIQTRVCIADWDGKNLTVWDSTQGVWNSKRVLADSLGLDRDNVRVIVKYLGGGFGSKAFAQRISFYAAKLSMVTGRPVKMERTKGEDFINHPHRPDCKMYIKMGAKKDGTLTAIYQRAIVNVGVAAGMGNYFPKQIIWHASNLYSCPNVYLEQIGVLTNLQITGPQRSPYNMTAIFALESHIDRLAEELGIDPLEFRFKNYTTCGYDSHEAPSDLVEVLSEAGSQETKIPYSSKKLDECMNLVAEGIGWNRRKSPRNDTQSRLKRGIGMATFVVGQGVGIPPYTAEADVVIQHDGTIGLFIGVVDIGAGQLTIFPMIAAEELGVRVDDITVMGGDTKDTRYAPSCQASRVTAEVGPAVLQAAAEARQALFAIAAPILGVRLEELQSKYGEIYVKSDPSKSISVKTVCRELHPDRPIRGSGSRVPTPTDYPRFATFGAQAVEVEVDGETGAVNILKVAASQDYGRAINPKLCISQIYGGIEFGIGYALSEEGMFDPKTGKMLNNNYHQYRIPTSLDMPPIEPFIVEDEDPYFAYSAKGGGECSNTPTPAAIRNAIYNAVGVWLNDLPMTPDRILKAIREKEMR